MALVRPDIDTYYMQIARVVMTRGTCPRRQVGCILTDEYDRVMSLGYNGVAAGLPHCADHPCPGVNQPSGAGLELCEALHAEQSALLICPDVRKIKTCYATTAPCITCVKLLLNTSCKRIVAGGTYAASGKNLWERAGRVWDVRPAVPAPGGSGAV